MAVSEVCHRLVDQFGDIDGDGFIEYRRGAEGGLANQGWKDSRDSVFHENGELAQGAIAILEVQAYAVAAKRAAAQIAAAIGKTELVERLALEADMLSSERSILRWIVRSSIAVLSASLRKKTLSLACVDLGMGHSVKVGVYEASNFPGVGRVPKLS